MLRTSVATVPSAADQLVTSRGFQDRANKRRFWTRYNTTALASVRMRMPTVKRYLFLIVIWLGSSALLQPVQANGDMLKLINKARAQGASCGRRWYAAAPPLRLNVRLSAAANRWARYMLRSGVFAHSHNGSTFARRITATCGRTSAGENLSGNRSGRDAMRRLLRSPGHCRNIMNPKFKFIGIGRAIGGKYGAYWVQKFASSC